MAHRIDRRTFTFGALSTSALAMSGCTANAFLAAMAADNSAFEPVSYSFETTDVCALNAQSTAGPFYLPDVAVRRHIAEDRPGVPLRVMLKVVDVNGCAPVPGALVDVWHCDALGVYAGYEKYGPDTGTGIPFSAAFGHVQHTDEKRYCRGVQASDAQGMVQFETIVPGWYTGRAPHIHIHVHTREGERKSLVFTNQLYFPDELMDDLYTSKAPYSERGKSTHNNLNDGVIGSSGGADGGYARVSELGEGYLATLTLALPS